MRRRTLQLRLQSIGDFPDGGWGAAPDIGTAANPLRSGMSPLTESPRATSEADADIVVIESRTAVFAATSAWRPAINAYRCQDKVVVFADLAGVPPESVRVQVEPGRLLIRGTRPAPEPDGEASSMCQLLALEIDHGGFERTLDLPANVNPDNVSVESRGGLYRIVLGLRS